VHEEDFRGDRFFGVGRTIGRGLPQTGSRRVRHQASGNYTQRPRNGCQLEPGNQKQVESDCDQIFYNLVDPRSMEHPPDYLLEKREPIISLTDRLSTCYTGAVYDVLRAKGYPSQTLPAYIRPLNIQQVVAGPVF